MRSKIIHSALLLFSFLLLFANGAFSRSVSRSEIEQVAERFISQRSATEEHRLVDLVTYQIRTIEEFLKPQNREILAYVARLDP